MKKSITTVRSIFILCSLLFIMIGSNCKAQFNFVPDTLFVKEPKVKLKLNLKQYVVPGSAMFLSGMLDGTVESIKFHYETGFRPRFNKIDDQFWNPEISWKNKYKNGDPVQGKKFMGSTTALVFTTDAYHALRTAKNLVNSFSVIFYLNKAKGYPRNKMTVKKMLLDAVVLTACRNLGFTAVYGGIFRQH